MVLLFAAPGPVGVFFGLTTLAYDSDARGAGALAGTAAEDVVWPLTEGVRTLAEDCEELEFVVCVACGAGVFEAMLVIRCSWIWVIVGNLSEGSEVEMRI